MERVADFIFFISKITVDGDCSHEIFWKKSFLLLERKAMTNLDSILKSRDITLQQRSIKSKLCFYSAAMYGCESWTIKRLNVKELVLLNCGVGDDS